MYYLVLITSKYTDLALCNATVRLAQLDVDRIVTQKETRTIGYFFDTCEGGNGAAEAIFSDLTNFATKAYALAAECDCEAGCPRCLYSTGCPQHNEALHKDLGLFLLDAISQAVQNT